MVAASSTSHPPKSVKRNRCSHVYGAAYIDACDVHGEHRVTAMKQAERTRLRRWSHREYPRLLDHGTCSIRRARPKARRTSLLSVPRPTSMRPLDVRLIEPFDPPDVTSPATSTLKESSEMRPRMVVYLSFAVLLTALSSLAFAQSTYQTFPTPGGGSLTYGPGGTTYQVFPTPGGGSITYGPGNSTYQTFPTPGGGSLTYGPGGSTYQTFPTPGGGSMTYGPGGDTYQTFPTPGGGSLIYGPGGSTYQTFPTPGGGSTTFGNR